MSNDGSKFLDVEDDDQRQARIGTLLEQLNTPSSTLTRPKPILDLGRQRAPGPIELPAELLDRVKSFLPAIAASNIELSKMNPEDVDIEAISEDEEEYIEMNLGLGVFETKSHRGSGSHPNSSSSGAHSSSDETSSESESDSGLSRASSEEDWESYSSSSDDDDDDEDDEDEDDPGSGSESAPSVVMKSVFSRLIRPLPRRASQHPKVEV